MKAKRLVALCDVLGFREFVRNEDLDALVERYKGLIKRTTYETRRIITMIDKEGTRDESFSVDYRVFSDAILLWSEPVERDDDETFRNAALFLQAISRLVGAGIMKALPLRIGLAYDECYISPDDQVYVGQAIVDAYLTEQRQDWIGAACHPSCLNNTLRY